MIYRNKHRLIKELEDRRAKGQIIHFLTGDGIGDNMFYGVREGILTVPDTLMHYYLNAPLNFDLFIHVANANDNIKCYKLNGATIEQCDFLDQIPKPEPDSPLKSRNGRKKSAEPQADAQQSESAKQGEQAAQAAADPVTTMLNHLDVMIRAGKLKIVIFLENLEWIANLHDTPEHIWISRMQLWQNAKNLLMISTIKDMELLKRYHFDQEEIFVSNPAADEIKYAYLRYLLRNAPRNYDLDLRALDDAAQGMSVGKKTLSACMRILRAVLAKNPNRLAVEDFSDSIERTVKEEVNWDKVRLDEDTKARIVKAVETFQNADEKQNPLKGFILTGPPGTGKTMIAKALANRQKCYFMAPTLADLKGEYIGHSSAKVKRVFAEARGNAPTILFIDEADTVFPSRALGAGDKDSFTLDMVNQFLQEIDGAQTGKQRIFTIAATNRPEAIDPAIKSRLSRDPIKIPLPTKEMRRLIFNDNFSYDGGTFSLDGKFFEDQVLTKSDSMSGRDIKTFVTKFKAAAEESGIKPGNNADTKALFDLIFQQREQSVIDELTSLGVFTRENIVAPSDNRLRLANIIGYDDLKEQIARQVDYIRATPQQKKRYDDYKITPRKGVLMYGPPGNGKSKLAQAVAGEYGFYFFKVLSRDFASSFPSDQIKNLERIFSEVTRFSKMADCAGIVLFFDEFDSLVGRDVLNGVVRGSLLSYVSDETGLRSKHSKILFMAATNFENRLDEAIKRRGRIDAHLFMDNPTEDNGRRMLKSFFDAEDCIKRVDDKIIQSAYRSLKDEKHDKLSRPSGAELEMLFKELKEEAFRLNKFEGKQLLIDAAVLAKRFRH